MFDVESLILTLGYAGIFGIIFAESGLFLGFFLPGDSLLFTAGVLASQGYLSIAILAPLTFFAAVLGDSFGYYFGSHIGPRLFTKPDSLLFRKENVHRAERFYQRHGPLALVLARFTPVIRTFVPILAGVGKMPYHIFLTYNLVGGFIWGFAIPLLGYFLGNTIPNVDKYLFPLVILIIIVSTLPGIIPIVRDPENRKGIARAFRKHILGRSA